MICQPNFLLLDDQVKVAMSTIMVLFNLSVLLEDDVYKTLMTLTKEGLVLNVEIKLSVSAQLGASVIPEEVHENREEKPHCISNCSSSHILSFIHKPKRMMKKL